MRNFNAHGLIARLRLAFLMILALAVAGCGGGGGGGSSSSNCPTQFSTCSTTDTNTGGGTTTTTAPTVTVAVLDSAGVETRTLPSSGSVTVKATVKNAAGATVDDGTLVTFTTNTALAIFSPASGTGLTKNGVTTIQMSAASLSAEGAAAVTATATVGTATVSGGWTYQVGAANLSLANFLISKPEIDAYGTSTVSVTVNVDGAPSTAPLTVAFASGCAASGKATLASTVQTINGVATATYTDKGCNSTDTITVSVLDKTLSGKITSAGPAPANIQFVSATPGTIALKGTAGLVDVSTVTFKVVDATGNPVPSASVDFYLSNWTGGLKLDDKTQAQVDALTITTGGVTSVLGKVRKQTAADGTVSVTVQAGSNPNSVWVLAKLKDSSLETQSSKLVISTGLPTQDRFSLSVGTHNIEGWNYDDVRSALTVLAFDRVGNPVPDGTTVNFVTEGAGVSPSPGVCSLQNATCTVQFVSGERRPQSETVGVCLNALGAKVPSTDAGRIDNTCVYSGRITVLAYANGEESFDDTNGDNLYQSATETHRRLGDAYVDNNEDGVWTSPEQYFPYLGTGDNASTGADCPTNYIRYSDAKSKANTCNTTWGQAQVRREQVIVLSGSAISNIYALSLNSYLESDGRVYVGDTFGGATGGSCSASFTVRISDLNNNVLPAGTTLDIEDNSVQYLQSGGTDPVSVAVTIGNNKILDTTIPGGTTHLVTMRGTKCVSIPAGSLTLKATTPKGLISYIPVRVNSAGTLTLTARSSNVSLSGQSLIATVSDTDFGVVSGACAGSFDLNLADINGALPTDAQLVSGPFAVVSGSVSYQVASSTPGAVATASAPASLDFVTNLSGRAHRVSFQGSNCIATTTPPGSIDSTVTLAVPSTRGRLNYIPVTVRRTP